MLFKSAGSELESVCVFYSVCNSKQRFVQTIALQRACLPCLLHTNKAVQPMRVPRVSDGCSSCYCRLGMPHTINIEKHAKHRNHLQHGVWNDCVSLVRLSVQRRAIDEVLHYVFFSRFSYILQEEGHKFMCNLRHFFEVFLTQCKDMHIKLIFNAKLS